MSRLGPGLRVAIAVPAAPHSANSLAFSRSHTVGRGASKLTHNDALHPEFASLRCCGDASAAQRKPTVPPLSYLGFMRKYLLCVMREGSFGKYQIDPAGR